MCRWFSESTDYPESYETGCGKGFVFNDDGVSENEFKFCPFCGQAIDEIPADEDPA